MNLAACRPSSCGGGSSTNNTAVRHLSPSPQSPQQPDVILYGVPSGTSVDGIKRVLDGYGVSSVHIPPSSDGLTDNATVNFYDRATADQVLSDYADQGLFIMGQAVQVVPVASVHLQQLQQQQQYQEQNIISAAPDSTQQTATICTTSMRNSSSNWETAVAAFTSAAAGLASPAASAATAAEARSPTVPQTAPLPDTHSARRVLDFHYAGNRSMDSSSHSTPSSLPSFPAAAVSQPAPAITSATHPAAAHDQNAASPSRLAASLTAMPHQPLSNMSWPSSSSSSSSGGGATPSLYPTAPPPAFGATTAAAVLHAPPGFTQQTPNSSLRDNYAAPAIAAGRYPSAAASTEAPAAASYGLMDLDSGKATHSQGHVAAAASSVLVPPPIVMHSSTPTTVSMLLPSEGGEQQQQQGMSSASVLFPTQQSPGPLKRLLQQQLQQRMQRSIGVPQQHHHQQQQQHQQHQAQHPPSGPILKAGERHSAPPPPALPLLQQQQQHMPPCPPPEFPVMPPVTLHQPVAHLLPPYTPCYGPEAAGNQEAGIQTSTGSSSAPYVWYASDLEAAALAGAAAGAAAAAGTCSVEVQGGTIRQLGSSSSSSSGTEAGLPQSANAAALTGRAGSAVQPKSRPGPLGNMPLSGSSRSSSPVSAQHAQIAAQQMTAALCEAAVVFEQLGELRLMHDSMRNCLCCKKVQRSAVLLPCKHLALCDACCQQMLQAGADKDDAEEGGNRSAWGCACPLCGAAVYDSICGVMLPM